jgi:hypothetical protein
LEAVKDHNRWDVPTLAVTAVIGVVALAFAAMTVLQGVLSAGPGHRKCSQNAIGYWSKNTKRRWNWSLFRRDSFAYTPVLTSSVIGGMCIEEYRGLWKHKKRTSTDSPATWLNLLKYIDMDDFVWDHFKMHTKRTAADYLPSEVQAVPAFIDVDTIVVLAAITGCDTLTIESEFGYPLITGATIQVHFRRDPFLGVVASFENYGIERSKKEELQKKVEKPLWHRLLFGDTKNPQSSKKHEFFPAQWGMLQYMSFGIPAISIDIHAKALQHPVPCRHHFGHDQAKLLRLLERPSLSWLLYAIPMNLVEIFPAKSAMIEALLGTVVVQGAYWSKSHLAKQDLAAKLELDFPYNGNWTEFWRQIDRVVYPERRELVSPWLLLAFCLEFTVDVRVGQKGFRRLPQHWKGHFRDELRREVGDIDYRIDSSGIDITKHCALAEMYIRSAALIDLAPFQKLLVRRQANEEHSQTPVIKSKLGFETAGDLLVAIHTWAEAEDVSPKETPRPFGQVFPRMTAGDLNLVYQSLSKLASQFDESIDPTQSSISPSVIDPIESVTEQHESIKSTWKGKYGPIDFMMKQQNPMQELLIYRAVLVALHCLIVLDNSDILESGIGKQIVPFL